MESAARPDWRNRGLAALALLVPTGAGLIYLAVFNAPSSYLLINAGALIVGLLWAAFGRLPSETLPSRTLALGLIALLALPLILGPEVEGISRWIPLGGFSLHVGMAVIPLVAVLAAQDDKLGRIALLMATLLVLYQPDPASILAILCAALGIALAKRDRYWPAFAILAVGAVWASATLRNLPPQEFVERVIPDLVRTSSLMAVFVALSLVASMALIMRASDAPKPQRFALAGALGGFILASLIGDYPSPLIGYGAAAIIGLGLALPAIREQK